MMMKSLSSMLTPAQKSWSARARDGLWAALVAIVAACLVLMPSAVRGSIAPSAERAAVASSRAPVAEGSDAWMNELGVRDLRARLKALTPEEPLGYFLLAEEVSAEARTRAELGLARQLFVLAMHGVPERGDEDLVISAIIGLGSVARNERERHWLTASARVLQTDIASGATRGRARLALIEPTDDAAFAFAEALGFARTGDGRRAETLLNRADVAKVLRAYEAVLNADGQVNAVQTLRRWVDEWPTCPECRNRRTVSRTDGPGTPVRIRLCATCGGMPGPKLSDAELAAQLRTEAALLRGIHRFWSSQYLVDQGEPLRDPSPESVALTFDVDVARPLYRDGRWTGVSK